MRNVSSHSTRNTRDSLTLVFLALLGLTAVAALLAVAGRDQRVWPSIAHRQPSGMAAFAELLRRDGYQVELEAYQRPQFPPEALVVSVDLPQDMGLFALDGTTRALVDSALLSHLAAGGPRMTLVMGEEFERASRNMSEATVQDLQTGRTYQLVTDHLYNWVDGDSLIATESSTWVYVYDREVYVTSALPFTNRFLDEGDNAELALSLVRRIVPPGSTVVFYEASFGNIAERRFFGTLGSWAVAAQWQVILLLLVVAWTLGKRFGLPAGEYVRERGTRELVDALAETMRSGRQYSWAGLMVRKQALSRARRVLRLPTGTPDSEVVDRLSEPAREALFHLEASCRSWSRPKQVVQAASRFDAAMRDFERRSTRRRTK